MPAAMPREIADNLDRQHGVMLTCHAVASPAWARRIRWDAALLITAALTGEWFE